MTVAEIDLNQIIDRLNTEFTGDTRKIVFWYDDKAEFAEDIENVELENAKVYQLKQDNQFANKRFLEREDTTTNYLISKTHLLYRGNQRSHEFNAVSSY